MIIEAKIKKQGVMKTEDCAVIAQKASKYKSDVYLIKDNIKINAKSIMGVILLNMRENDIVYISVQGDDENACADALKQTLEK